MTQRKNIQILQTVPEAVRTRQSRTGHRPRLPGGSCALFSKRREHCGILPVVFLFFIYSPTAVSGSSTCWVENRSQVIW